MLTGFARAFHKLGMAREAREKLEGAIELYHSKSDYDFHLTWESCDGLACYDVARACAVLDRREEAARWLEDAVRSRWHDRGFMGRDESMASMGQAIDFGFC